MLKLLFNIDKYSSIFMLVVMCFCIIIQVFFRYFLSNALEWPEEVARYTFICAVFLGASYAASEGRHLEIGILKNLFGLKMQLIVSAISTIFTLVFCGIMCVWGIDLVYFIKDSGQVAASIDFEMYILYTIVPISMLFMGIRSIVYFINHWKNCQSEECPGSDQNIF